MPVDSRYPGSNPGGGPKIKKPYNTRDSHVVPYRSTDRAQRCLTSQFGWDAVLSPWYDRMTVGLRRGPRPVWRWRKSTPAKREVSPAKRNRARAQITAKMVAAATIFMKQRGEMKKNDTIGYCLKAFLFFGFTVCEFEK